MPRSSIAADNEPAPAQDRPVDGSEAEKITTQYGPPHEAVDVVRYDGRRLGRAAQRG